MLQPPGFDQSAISTSLGKLVYYRPNPASEPQALARTAVTPMLFLHGFGGGSSAYEWSLVYPAFASDYRVFAPDLLGWGRSDHLSRSYQIQDYLIIITELLEQLCGAPAIVVASSLTAALTIRVAVMRPELVKALLLEPIRKLESRAPQCI